MLDLDDFEQALVMLKPFIIWLGLKLLFDVRDIEEDVGYGGIILEGSRYERQSIAGGEQQMVLSWRAKEFARRSFANKDASGPSTHLRFCILELLGQDGRGDEPEYCKVL